MLRYLNLITITKSIVIFLLLFVATSTLAEDRPALTSFTPTDSITATSKRGSSTGSGASTQPAEHVKRNIKATDLSASSYALAKSYDPQPEFYRGAGSTTKVSPTSSSSATSIDTPYHRDSATASFISKPITFPGIIGHQKQDSKDASQQLANSFNNWEVLRGQGGQDRISVKPYAGSDTHVLASGYAPGGGGGGGVQYSYPETRPYSGEHYIDYGPTHAGGGQYAASGHGGYYGGANSAEAGATSFDVYGGKGSGHYAGAGGEYSYTFPQQPHELPAHKGHHDLSQKALLAKSFLIPLASAAVLGLAAALVSNPLLLQLGTVSGLPVGATVLGKRRRRRDVASLNSAKTGLATSKDKAMPAGRIAGGANMAYRAHRSHRMARV